MAAEVSSPAPDGEPEPESEPESERSGDRTGSDGAPAPGPIRPAAGGVQWIEGSADAGYGDGLRWSWELDLGELLSAAGLAGAGVAGDAGEEVDQEAALAAELAAVEASGGRGAGRDLTGALAEHLPAGPGLAAWLAAGPAGEWSDWDLPGVAAAFRRVASWAQAGELAAVAAIASRTAARDPKIGAGEDGRPAGMAVSAVAEVSLALSMSQVGASWWTSLGVALQWRLAATGAALAAGNVDVGRARLIAEATAPLADEVAQAVEARVLPGAGGQTTGQLRAALRRAVIAADPRGADDRRRASELQARVRLYADDAGTASLVASGLPAVLSAAAMARLTALARGLRASGTGGGLDLLRSQVLMGLVLGTMPLIPPGPGDPPGPAGPGDSGGGSGPPGRQPEPAGTRDGSGPAGSSGWPGGHGPGQPTGDGQPADPDPSWRDVPPLGDADEPPPGHQPDWDPRPEPEDDDPAGAGCPVGRTAPAWPPLPDTLAQIPPLLGTPPLAPAGAWPLAQPRRDPGDGRPPPGLIDLTISWSALAGHLAGPAQLSWIGPVTAAQARLLAVTAAGDPHATWRVVLTGPDGRALAVERIRRPRATATTGASASAGPPGTGPPGPGRPHVPGTPLRAPGVTGRVTVSFPLTALTRPPPSTSGGTSPGCPGSGILTATWRAAARACAKAEAAQAADAAAGGCAHTTASPAYRPPPRIREYVTARDQTCRQPTCRQPAAHADLDHTTPYHHGGRTCHCNLGGHCRTHHQLKQQPGWTLTQPRPGHFQLTTPAGRSYATTPDPYPG